MPPAMSTASDTASETLLPNFDAVTESAGGAFSVRRMVDIATLRSRSCLAPLDALDLGAHVGELFVYVERGVHGRRRLQELEELLFESRLDAQPRFEIHDFVCHVFGIDAFGEFAVAEAPDFGEHGAEALGGNAHDERHVGCLPLSRLACGARHPAALAFDERRYFRLGVARRAHFHGELRLVDDPARGIGARSSSREWL